MQEKIALTGGVIYSGQKCLEQHALLIGNGQIEGMVLQGDIPGQYKLVDTKGACIAPGLIDLQVYGGGGKLFAGDCTAESAETISKALVRTGTTGYFMTLATNTLEVFSEAIEVMKSYRHPALMGLHFEGPYLNKQKRGAHPEALIRKASPHELRELILSAEGHLRMMTIAPEEVDTPSLQVLLDAGILVSAGHSMASFEQGMQGFKQGIAAATHLFNAMSPFHHRDAGLPGAVFQDNQVRASIIADGIHVAYPVIEVAKKLLRERLFLITDAVAESHTGIYRHHRKQDHYVLPDGTLSGSALTLLEAVGNCVQHASIPLDEALRMATQYPADLIGRKDLGRLEPGSRANVIVFDSEFRIERVYLDGEPVQID